MLCLIPARSGSKRLPGKNWLEVGGKTLVQRAVDCALGAGLKPYVVTDAPERCEGLGAAVLREPDELAGDDVPMSAVIQWANPERRTVVLLQPTSPLTLPSDVMGCIRAHRASCGECDVVSVVARNRVIPLGASVIEGRVPMSQPLPTQVSHVYERNGAVYIMRGNEISGLTQLYVMPPERSVDIDTAEDLEEARRIAGP